MSELVDLLPIVLVAFVLWLSGLSYAFFRLLKHYRRIAVRSKDGDIMSLVENLLSSEEENSASIKKVRDEIVSINARSVLPVQKVGLVRFNPFAETGGDQSFSLCLLNGEEDGLILTGLHTRDRTRVYTKPVTGGVSKYELSREEERSLKEAKKI